MSTALAIAAVTAHLKDVLNNGLADAATETPVIVTAYAPDKAETENAEASRLNLFLYQVGYNAAWRNMGMPIRNSDGNRISQSPLAIDLHYLLTAYDGGNEYGTEILLGYAMQLMHETPVLTRSQIRRSAASRIVNDVLPSRWQTVIIESGLAEQIEQIKITPQTLSTEEISRLWAAFGTKYRPTVAYQVSVVLIESQLPAKAAPPVMEPKVYVNTLRQPTIDKIQHLVNFENPTLPERAIVFSDDMVVTGHRLRGNQTLVRINGVEFPARISERDEGPNVTDNKIEMALSSPQLKAGIQAVQIVHRIPKEDSTESITAAESNVSAFILRPVVIISDESDELRSPVFLRGPDRVRMRLSPAVRQDQKVVLLLTEFIIGTDEARSRARTFRGELKALADTETIEFPITLITEPAPPTPPPAGPAPRLPRGRYLVRVQVDGAESLLSINNSHPDGSERPAAEQNRYNTPLVNIT